MENQGTVAIPEAELNALPGTFEAWVAWFAERGASVDLFTHIEPIYPIERMGEAAGFVIEYETELTITSNWRYGGVAYEIDVRGTGLTPLEALKNTIWRLRKGGFNVNYYSR